MSALVEAERLQAGYRKVAVVRDLSFSLEAGEIVALLGANGAGKTTTLVTLAGQLAPLGGVVRVFGRVLAGRGAHVVARRGLALVPQDRGLFSRLTVRENLRLAERRRLASRIPAVLEVFPALEALLGRRAGVLSGGEQQMLTLGRALLAEPRVLLIDEMSLGLAPQVVEHLLGVVHTVASERGTGVLLVEQHAALALSIATRALVLDHGRLAFSGTVDELSEVPGVLETSYLGGARGH